MFRFFFFFFSFFLLFFPACSVEQAESSSSEEISALWEEIDLLREEIDLLRAEAQNPWREIQYASYDAYYPAEEFAGRPAWFRLCTPNACTIHVALIVFNGDESDWSALVSGAGSLNDWAPERVTLSYRL